MELTEKTLTVLNNFAVINKGLFFQVGDTLRTGSVTGSIIAEAKVDTSIETDFRLYDLSRFLATVSLFTKSKKTPALELHDNRVVLTEGKTSVAFHYAEPEKVVSPTEGVVPEAVFKTHLLFQTQLGWEKIKELEKAAKVLGLPSFAFTDEGEGLYLMAIDPSGKVKDSYSVDIGPSTGRTFQLIISLDNLKLIPADYAVEVGWKQMDGRGRGITRWTGMDFNVTYYIQPDRLSRVNG